MGSYIHLQEARPLQLLQVCHFEPMEKQKQKLTISTTQSLKIAKLKKGRPRYSERVKKIVFKLKNTRYEAHVTNLCPFLRDIGAKKAMVVSLTGCKVVFLMEPMLLDRYSSFGC